MMSVSLLLDPLEEIRLFNLANYLLIVSLSWAALRTGKKKYYDLIILLEIALLAFFLFKM